MATTTAQDYVRSLAKYLLLPGTPPDLSVKLGDRTWPVHRLLACSQSEWFKKAAQEEFQEGQACVITLEDGPVFEHAVEAMTTFFYNACYETDTSRTRDSLLHASVAAIADKYVCPALSKHARCLFDAAVKKRSSIITTTEGLNNWVQDAGMVYEHMGLDIDDHKQMRKSTMFPFKINPNQLRAALQNENFKDFLLQNAAAATDLLSHTAKHDRFDRMNVQRWLLGYVCGYIHVEDRNCPQLEPKGVLAECPFCGLVKTVLNAPKAYDLKDGLRCECCGGKQAWPAISHL